MKHNFIFSLVAILVTSAILMSVGCSKTPPPAPQIKTVTVHDTVVVEKKVVVNNFVRHISTVKAEVSHGIDTLSFSSVSESGEEYPKEYIGKILLGSEDGYNSEFRVWIFKKTTIFNSVVTKERLSLGDLSGLSGQELGFTIKGEPKKFIVDVPPQGDGSGGKDTVKVKVASEVDLVYKKAIDFGN